MIVRLTGTLIDVDEGTIVLERDGLAGNRTITGIIEARDADGNWKDGKYYRGSQVYALVYCLQKCSEWILAQRDPQQSSPF